jgi:iron complex outermembrane recepter protein
VLRSKSFVVFCSCLPAFAQAQSPTPSAKPEQTMSEVTVSGVSDVARAGIFGDRKVQETPFSVTPFTSELVRDQQSRRLGDVLSNDSSTRSVGTTNGETETFQIRGLTVQANEVAYDGLYGLQMIRRTGVAYADRIEVFKGPNAVINGISPFGSFGGVINVVPKRAGADPVTDLTLEASTKQSLGGSLDLGRRFGPDQAFGVRLNAAARDGENAIEGSENDFGAVDLAFDYKNGGLRLTFDAGYQKDNYKANQQTIGVAAGLAAVPAAPDGSLNLSQAWGSSVSEDKRFVLGLHYEFARDWTASMRYGELEHTEDFRTPTALTIINAAGDYTFRAVRQPAVFKTETGDIGLRGKFATGAVKHELALNATHYYADNKFAFSIFGPTNTSNIYNPVASAQPNFGPTPNTAAPGNERTFKTFAAADTMSFLGDDLQVTLGLRQQSIEVTNYVNVSDNAPGTVSSVIDQQKVSPVAAVLYKLSRQWAIYANASEGLAPGPQAPGGTVNAGTVLPPIEAKSYEVGTKADYGRFGATAALFRTTQQVGITNPTTLVFATDGEAQVSGLELNVFGTPWRNLKLIGGITLLEAEQTKTAGGTNNGKQAVGVPESLMSLYAEWRTPLPGFSVTGRYLYTDGQFLDAANTRSIPDWSRIDLGMKYVFPNAPVTLRATVENVTDEAYWASARNGVLTRGAPRAGFVSAEINF